MQVDRLKPEDLEPVLSLLESSSLPLDGFADHLATALVARANGTVVGSAALEIYPDGALLRSVAVAPSLRGHGLGGMLTHAAIDLAQSVHAPAIYLLTTTAESFFPRFGFERIERQDVPPGVQSSAEFAGACPSSATVMRRVF
jgi:amino-acid N-acetyltransferase